MTIGRFLFYLGLLTGLIALSIRYPMNIYGQLVEGETIYGAFAHLFSYFTIVMNTLVVLCYLARVPTFQRYFPFFKRPAVTATAIAGILIVMIVYHLLLSATHNPEGISVFTNICLHYIAPVVFPIWWYLEGRDGNMEWKSIPAHMIIPLIYLVWVFARGAITGKYPYDFLNVAEKGIAGVAPVLAAITLLFLVLGSIVVILDKRYLKTHDR